ncbi:MAG TPA: ComEC/Rec2 family competence protein [Prolixibacteraceae bacterium]|nr:ComEC/Rec2 family competence protein [Prolixibacteraceae bacterium]
MAAKIGHDERAVISALTLGYRAELDQETMNYFADTGTIHVLSVSGLHVAIIFIILNFFFSPVNTGKYGKFIHGALIILCLWSYAFISGFSPSVQRSTVMFSFVIMGNILRRPVNIYNSLSASALVLILLDPLVLFDIGFQLSYLAVFGIVLIQPPLENMLKIKNKILKGAWTLFTVSIAAQLITFPLSVYYFNQFPTLFWLSSFVAIPGTTLILWLTIGFFILSPVSMLSGLLVDLIQFITHLLLVILKWMSSLPHAVIEGIIYNQLQTLIMYAFITTFVVYVFSKRKIWLYSGMVLLISFQASMLWTKYSMFNQKVLYVYQTKGCLIHCINGRNSYVIKYNDDPFTGKDIYMIRKVCNHLKLNRPRFINTRKTTEIATSDLIVNSKRLCFLNCRIDYTNQLKFCVYGNDEESFKRINPSLMKKVALQPSPYSSRLNISNQETFSVIFTTAFKEGVCIFMN